MKKTIIASAVAAAVAAPAAFADVKISGMVNPEFSDSNASTGYDASVNTDLVISGSEDLGNGLKASFKYHLFHDDGASTTASTTSTVITSITAATSMDTVLNSASVSNKVADLSVALSGDFGAVKLGRFETHNMAYFHGKADLDPSHDITLEDTNGTQSRDNGGIEYTGNFNGVTVVAGMHVDAGDGNSGTDTEDTDITDIAIKYSINGLTVAAGQTVHKSSAADEEVTNLFAEYKMGDLTVRALNREVEGSATNDLTTVGAAYKMGANTIAYSVTDSDDAQDGDSVLSVSHAMSKNTNVYIARKNDDDGEDTTLIGMKVKF